MKYTVLFLFTLFFASNTYAYTPSSFNKTKLFVGAGAAGVGNISTQSSFGGGGYLNLGVSILDKHNISFSYMGYINPLGTPKLIATANSPESEAPLQAGVEYTYNAYTASDQKYKLNVGASFLAGYGSETSFDKSSYTGSGYSSTLVVGKEVAGFVFSTYGIIENQFQVAKNGGYISLALKLGMASFPGGYKSNNGDFGRTFKFSTTLQLGYVHYISL